MLVTDWIWWDSIISVLDAECKRKQPATSTHDLKASNWEIALKASFQRNNAAQLGLHPATESASLASDRDGALKINWKLTDLQGKCNKRGVRACRTGQASSRGTILLCMGWRWSHGNTKRILQWWVVFNRPHSPLDQDNLEQFYMDLSIWKVPLQAW